MEKASCGEYTEANRAMKRLGGIHDERNLRALDGKENIKKKDKLTEEAFEILKNDVSFLSKWHREVFEKHQHQGLKMKTNEKNTF